MGAAVTYGPCRPLLRDFSHPYEVKRAKLRWHTTVFVLLAISSSARGSRFSYDGVSSASDSEQASAGEAQPGDTLQPVYGGPGLSVVQPQDSAAVRDLPAGGSEATVTQLGQVSPRKSLEKADEAGKSSSTSALCPPLRSQRSNRSGRRTVKLGRAS